MVFLDESGFAHNRPRPQGYALKGQKCYGKHDWGSKGRTNVIGALLAEALLTVSLFLGSINTEVFTTWVTYELIPKLPPKSVVILDKAAFHKKAETLLTEAGHTGLFLPPYSPDLNPIEKKGAQAKALRRKIGGTIEQLFQNYEI